MLQSLCCNIPGKFTAVFLGVIAIFITSGTATTVIPPTFEEMTARADLVFVGKTVSSHCEWRMVGKDQVIFTFVEFEPQEILKGNAGKSVRLQFLGGTVGDTTLKVGGVPKFKTGDRVILFVEKNGFQICPIVGMYHGKFSIRIDEKTRTEAVFMHDGKPLLDVGQIGTGEAEQFAPRRSALPIQPQNAAVLSINDFRDKVREQIAKGISAK